MDPGMWVAIITALGGIVVAIVGNWDKLFRRNSVITATFSGYRPTGDFETEYRHYFEVSGARKALESWMLAQFRDGRVNALSEVEGPGEADEINKAFDRIERETPRYLDDVIRAYLPVYQRHFTLAELQELNKFYSTEAMQHMVQQLPAVMQEATPLTAQLVQEFVERALPDDADEQVELSS